MRGLQWSYGITTTSKRRDNLLPRTLASLKVAGFPEPRLFVDGDHHAGEWVKRFGTNLTLRHPNLRTYGTWVLALAELFIRSPQADRFLLCQDDFVTYRNLRQYLERIAYQPQRYYNLYTFPMNVAHVTKANGGTLPGNGWHESNQRGKGAVALMFDREAVMTLLTSQHMVSRPLHAGRGWRNVDGGVVDALKKAGWKEMIHLPSLVQHTGIVSSMGNKQQPLACTFRGEDFDALELLHGSTVNPLTVGCDAYNHLPEANRAQCLAAWQQELDAIRRAIVDDQQRLDRAATPTERRRYSDVIADYQDRLRRTEANNPPYYTQEALRIMGEGAR